MLLLVYNNFYKAFFLTSNALLQFHQQNFFLRKNDATAAVNSSEL